MVFRLASYITFLDLLGCPSIILCFYVILQVRLIELALMGIFLVAIGIAVSQWTANSAVNTPLACTLVRSTFKFTFSFNVYDRHEGEVPGLTSVVIDYPLLNHCMAFVSQCANVVGTQSFPGAVAIIN